MKYDFVLEGGGAKILGLVGSLAAIEEKGFQPNYGAGTSAGAIVAALRTAGYLPSELKTILMELNLKEFKTGAPWGTKTYHLFKHKGIYSSDKIHSYVSDLLAAKGVTTFGDVVTDQVDPRWRYLLNIIASDVSQGRMVNLPHDAPLYGMRPEDINIADAVRMSMSIPGFFRPARLGESYIVDGGLLSNFPIWIYDSMCQPSCPTFGIILHEPNSDERFKIKGVLSYMEAIFRTMMKAHDQRSIHSDDYFHRLIKVPTGDISATDFNITQEEKAVLYNSGYRATKEFFNDWSWPKYLKWAKQVRGIV